MEEVPDHSESPPPMPKESTTLLLLSQLKRHVSGLGIKRAISEAAIFEGFLRRQMSSACRSCLRHQFRISCTLRPFIGIRRYTAYAATSTATADDDKPYNSFSLRVMVEHLLRTQRPESAEEILKKTDLEGHGVAFSWNLCLKYYAKKGDIGECDRIYQLVTSP